MKYWITESHNTSNPTGSMYCIDTWQPCTNMRPTAIDNGWLGETNNISCNAHGKFDTMPAARVALRNLVGDHKMVVVVDAVDAFLGLVPNDYRGKRSSRPSELWNADGSVDFIVQSWREEFKSNGKPGDDDYIEGGEYKRFFSVNVTSLKINDVTEFHDYIDFHYFQYEHDDKKTLVHQAADGSLTIIVKKERIAVDRRRVWEIVQEHGISV